MPLHDRESIRDQIDDCVFADRDLSRPVHKYHFPPEGSQPRDAYQIVADELMLDGNARQNLATFCQTWEEPQVLELMALSINKNMIDRDEYPQTAEIERRCVHMMADLWNAPESANTVGASAIGSSEACMLAGMAAKWRWRAKRQAEGKPTDKPNFVCGPVQVVWHKFARYWDVEIREVPMAPGRYGLDPASVLERVDENTIMVVPTLGVTYTGSYEPVEAIAAALDQLQAETGLDIDIHVDAASGGFLAPFCAPDLKFDFRLPRVKSISASGHKFGLAPLGVGWVVWRDAEELPQDLIFHVNYLGGDMPVFQINFSRPGRDHRQLLQLPAAGLRGLPPDPAVLLRHRPVPGGRDRQARSVRAALRQQPGDRHSHRHLAHPRGRGPGLHTVRPGRPAAQQGLAGAGLHPDRIGLRHPRPAHPGPARREPGHRHPAPGGLPQGGASLQQAPGAGADEQGGGRRVQPPVTRRA